jgi:alpha-ribazole phosphatase
MTGLMVWRHPRPRGVAGRCIGCTDVPVDPRKAKRLAHRIRRAARRDGAARVVWTSPLRRGADVGRWLARWGWSHHVDPRLSELDFGAWDGRPWDTIGAAEVDAWCAAFASHAPGGGESVTVLMARCAAFMSTHPDAWVVGHAGWINAAARVMHGLPPPSAASEWPAPVGYGVAWRASSSRGAESQ